LIYEIGDYRGKGLWFGFVVKVIIVVLMVIVIVVVMSIGVLVGFMIWDHTILIRFLVMWE
jgi:hypothetical protein